MLMDTLGWYRYYSGTKPDSESSDAGDNPLYSSDVYDKIFSKSHKAFKDVSQDGPMPFRKMITATVSAVSVDGFDDDGDFVVDDGSDRKASKKTQRVPKTKSVPNPLRTQQARKLKNIRIVIIFHP